MQRYDVELIGDSPLLLHADNLEWRGQMERWGADPQNKRISKAGDDRTPAWRWLGCCYHNGQVVGIASDNLMTTLREGGTKVPVPGKRSATFKRQTQSGLLVNEMLWPVLVNGQQVPWQKIAALINEPDFEKHEATARECGFELFAKSVRIGTSKHIRVRPRFDRWSVAGSITVIDDSITRPVLENVLMMAGTYCGIGDWRPSAPKSPGPWGKFHAVIREA